MGLFRAVTALGPLDARTIWRDPLLRWVALMPISIAVPARFILPGAIDRIDGALGTDLMPHYVPLMGAALLLFTPAMVGMVIGFLLLDQRDDGTLQAMRVTPLPLGTYLTYRLSAPMAVSTVLTCLCFPIAGLNEIGAIELAIAALSAAPLAPLYALTLGAFAANKVQGFALVKVLGILPIAPLIAYAIDSPGEIILALAPTTWPALSYWAFLEGDASALMWAGLGFIYAGLLILPLLRRTSERNG